MVVTEKKRISKSYGYCKTGLIFIRKQTFIPSLHSLEVAKFGRATDKNKHTDRREAEIKKGKRKVN